MIHINKQIAAACGVVIVSLGATHSLPAAADVWSAMEVRSGTASFEVSTNVASITVHGKSTELDARANVHDGSSGLTVESAEATLPVKSLATGMSLRDEHMRKLVFTDADGNVPDLKFVSREAKYASEGTKRQLPCTVSGDLAIRGVLRPFAMTLTITGPPNGSRSVAAVDGCVNLSPYCIDHPSQSGVRTRDEVKLHLDFTARPANDTTAGLGGDR